jgi:hypothetical protein
MSTSRGRTNSTGGDNHDAWYASQDILITPVMGYVTLDLPHHVDSALQASLRSTMSLPSTPGCNMNLHRGQHLATWPRTNHRQKSRDNFATKLLGGGGTIGVRTNKPKDGEGWNQTWGYPEVPPLEDYETAALPLSYAGASDSIAEAASSLQCEYHARSLPGRAPLSRDIVHRTVRPRNGFSTITSPRAAKPRHTYCKCDQGTGTVV